MAQLVHQDDHRFVVTADDGDVSPARSELEAELGLYARDTRHLSLLELRVDAERPDLLVASQESDLVLTLLYGNRARTMPDGTVVLPHTLSFRRRRFLFGALYEQLIIRNHNPFAVPLRVSYRLGADFRDIFDVRGLHPSERGAPLRAALAADRATLEYLGLDGLARWTIVHFDPAPSSLVEEANGRVADDGVGATVPDATFAVPRVVIRPVTVRASWDLDLAAQESVTLSLTCSTGVGDDDASVVPSAIALIRAREEVERWQCEATEVTTGDEQVNVVLRRSAFDLYGLTLRYPTGPLLAAGVPWFVAPFGRDSLLAAREALLFQPQLAVGTLRFLAAHQAQAFDDWRDAEPGKILHELRSGEMARTGEVPHTPYYGTIDATPLFVWTFAETVRWLGDWALFDELLPAARLAIAWIDQHGDSDGDGYLEYRARSGRGLANQGWRDSDAANVWPDGRQADAPIALVEVQGYVYAAKRAMAALVRRRGEGGWADTLDRQAADLADRFNRDFWDDGERYLATALDAQKRRVMTVTSAPGQALWTGIVDPDKARTVIERLLSPELSSGWGIRTMSDRMGPYNPMSYHNGSVWPHDTALIAAGMRRYGEVKGAVRLASDLLRAALRFRRARLPELFCGFDSNGGDPTAPAEYPAASNPQAWAAAAPFLLIETLLGLEVDGFTGRVSAVPAIPDWLGTVTVRRIQAGNSTTDVVVRSRDWTASSYTRS